MAEDERRKAARRMIETVPAIMQAVASEMRQCDNPMPLPHFRLLMVLAHQGPHSLTELAEKQRVSLPTMSNTVKVLVERGWAERVADERDRRRVGVQLTAVGGQAVRDVNRRIEDLIVSHLRDMPAEELAELEAGLAVLRRAFTTPRARGNAREGDPA